MRYLLNRISYSKVGSEPLSDERLKFIAPSVFATGAMDGVSDRYSFLPTIDVISEMKREGWQPVFCNEQRVRLETRKGFQKHLIRFQRKEHLSTLTEFRPEIVLVNSHDCTCAYQIHAGIFRLVCLNGLIVADCQFAKISIRHSGSTPQDVIDASFEVLEEVPKMCKRVERFQSRKLAEVERQSFAEAALLLKYEDLEQAPIQPDRLLMPRRIEDRKPDLWTTLNTVQENLLRGGLRDFSRRKPDNTRFQRTREVKGIDENVKLNKGLWNLAEMLYRN